MGNCHARAMAKGSIDGMTLAAVADLRESQRQWAKENLPEAVKIFTTAEELLAEDGIDAVLVATPHYDHPELVIKTLLCSSTEAYCGKKNEDVLMNRNKVTRNPLPEI